MKNVAWLIGIFLILVHVFLTNKNADFVKKTIKVLSKHLCRCPKKLQQQHLQEVHNYHNNVKNSFYIKNRESLLENVDDGNNVSTAEEILTEIIKIMVTM